LLLALLALAAAGGCGTGAALDPNTEKDIDTLSGRTELWWDVVLLVQKHWCIGVGFYASRYFLLNTWDWAGHTHNSFLEVALSTGVVGLVICTLFVGHVARAIWRTRDGLLLGTAAYCMIIGNINPLIFYPGLQMFVLMVALIGSSPRRP
jgi:O-antigen ligase